VAGEHNLCTDGTWLSVFCGDLRLDEGIIAGPRQRSIGSMQNKDSWKPSKFVYKKGRLIGSRNRAELGISSRLVADIIAHFYDQSLKQYARGRLLDLGCGKVPLYAAYQGSVTDIFCVDWANSLHKNHYLDLELDLTGNFPFADNEFDTIILSDVLEHIAVPEHIWKEMARVLSKDGKLLMNVPFFYWLHEEPYDYYRYKEHALRRFVDISGMRLVQLSSIGGVPEIMADIFAKTIVRLPKLGNAAALFVQWCAWNFTRSGFGRQVSDATSRAFPLGYFLIAEKAHLADS
jgi:SAM-dependent methyltransferase